MATSFTGARPKTEGNPKSEIRIVAEPQTPRSLGFCVAPGSLETRVKTIRNCVVGKSVWVCVSSVQSCSRARASSGLAGCTTRTVNVPAARSGAGFLQMDEGSGELNQALVEIPRGLPPDRQPEIFEDFMRFEIALPVEAIEPRQVTRILALPGERGGERGNLLGLGIHAAERSRRVARNKAPGRGLVQ